MKVRNAALAFGMCAVALSGCAGHSPYAGLESREVKALSAEETAGLLSGEGMGMAMAAELNGYPGPLHLLELADDLALSDSQRAAVAAMFSQMRGEASELGRKIVDAETELDSLFADRRANEPDLRKAVADIARLKGELRAAHLKWHLRTVPLLTPAQIARYDALRGYHSGHSHSH